MRAARDHDVIEISQRMRRVLSAYYNARHVIEAAMPTPNLEAAAAALRPTLADAAESLYQFLTQLEQTPVYIEACRTRLHVLGSPHGADTADDSAQVPQKRKR